MVVWSMEHVLRASCFSMRVRSHVEVHHDVVGGSCGVSGGSSLSTEAPQSQFLRFFVPPQDDIP